VRRLLSRCGWDAEGRVERREVRDSSGDKEAVDVDEMGSSEKVSVMYGGLDWVRTWFSEIDRDGGSYIPRRRIGSSVSS
jgi:hypothetical protein